MGRMTTRAWAAVALIAIALALNIGLLIADEVSASWGLALVILIGAAGASLLAERRPWQ